MRVVSFITQPRLIRRILDHIAGRARGLVYYQQQVLARVSRANLGL